MPPRPRPAGRPCRPPEGSLMGWLATIGDLWLTALGWLVGLGAIFAVLTRLSPCNPGQSWWSDWRSARTDLAYWFVVPPLLMAGRTAMLVAGVVIFFGGQAPPPSPTADWPLWAQAAAILVIQDVLLYWLHRAFHTAAGWRFHAVHHSPRVLDWVSASRFHPVNHLLEFALADTAVLLLGFPPAVLVAVAPANILLSSLVHANLDWTFGPLRYVVASPVFHRWHHTTEAEGRDKNFAPTLPVLDLVFGTFHMPPGRRPARYGTGDADFPDGLGGQLVHPFRDTRAGRWARSRPALASATAGLAVIAVLSGWAYVDARVAEPGVEEPGALPSGPVPGPVVSAPGVTAVAATPDGRWVVAGDEGGLVKVMDRDGRVDRTLPGHARRVTGVAVTPDGRWVVSAGADGVVRAWGQTGPARTLAGHAGAVLGVAVTADGRRVVTGGVDGAVRVWDENGRVERSLAAGPGAVTGVAVSADGRRVVVAGPAGATVWDPDSDRAVPLRGHADLVYGVAITPDGARVVTGSLDGRVKVWDAETGGNTATLEGHDGPVYGVAVSA